ncbi:MAG TPA: hypothetical protein VIA80_13475 [Hyphomonadaceae bacterium]|jgi:hypothetical protein
MKLREALSAVAVAIALSGAAHAQAVQGLDGDWTGKLEAGGATLTVIFHIKTADGKTTVTLDSPDQNTAGIPVNSIARDGQNVSMDVAAVMGSYQGTLAADGKSIAGTWSQLDNALPLVVTKK